MDTAGNSCVCISINRWTFVYTLFENKLITTGPDYVEIKYLLHVSRYNVLWIKDKSKSEDKIHSYSPSNRLDFNLQSSSWPAQLVWSTTETSTSSSHQAQITPLPFTRWLNIFSFLWSLKRAWIWPSLYRLLDPSRGRGVCWTRLHFANYWRMRRGVGSPDSNRCRPI